MTIFNLSYAWEGLALKLNKHGIEGYTAFIENITALSRKKAMTNMANVSKVFILTGVKVTQLTLFFLFFFSKTAPCGKIQIPSATIGATSST